MFYIESVGGLPKEKLSKAWTHTLSVFGLLAAIVTIVSFLGYHPSREPAPKQPASQPQVKAPSKEEPRDNPAPTATDFKPPKPNHTGTIHLEGGFPPGQPMLTTDAVQAGEQTAPLALTDSRTSRSESVSEVLSPLPIGTKHPVALWRKGTRFVKGIHFSSPSSHLHLAGAGLPGVDIPTDADGRIQTNLVWPLDRIFTEVDYVGPVEISGLALDGGLSFGDPDSAESGKTLPARFSIDVPRPGEILGASRGDFTYPSPSDARWVRVEALSQSGGATATWSASIDSSGSASIRDPRTDLFSGELAGLRILYSKSGT